MKWSIRGVISCLCCVINEQNKSDRDRHGGREKVLTVEECWTDGLVITKQQMFAHEYHLGYAQMLFYCFTVMLSQNINI